MKIKTKEEITDWSIAILIGTALAASAFITGRLVGILYIIVGG